MAAPGPSDRKFEIDNAAGDLTDYSSVIRGEPSGVAELEREFEDVTGPTDGNPRIVDPAFESFPDFTITFDGDKGGSPDPVADFWLDRSGPRTVKHTLKTGWTWQCEAHIKKSAPKTPVRGTTPLEVTFGFTGSATLT